MSAAASTCLICLLSLPSPLMLEKGKVTESVNLVCSHHTRENLSPSLWGLTAVLSLLCLRWYLPTPQPGPGGWLGPQQCRGAHPGGCQRERKDSTHPTAEGQKHWSLSVPRLLSPDTDDTLGQIILYCGDLGLTVLSAPGLCSMNASSTPCHGTPNIFVFHIALLTSFVQVILGISLRLGVLCLSQTTHIRKARL